MSTYVTSDWHGFTFKKESVEASIERVLNTVRFSDDDSLYILGDIFDRGNGEAMLDAVRFVMSHEKNVHLILGNHEKFLLDCSFLFEPKCRDVESLLGTELSKVKLWFVNGGEPTYHMLCSLSQEERTAIFKFLRKCPLYEKIKINYRKYILVHAGLGGFSKRKKLEEYSEEQLLWFRPKHYSSFKYNEDTWIIFGHTPVQLLDLRKNSPIFNKAGGWIAIDTGSALGYGPVFLRLDDKKTYYPYVEY